MPNVTFDLEALRTFVAGLEMGSFARAAERLGRSTSSVSAQIKRLEDQAGTMILRKAGRGLIATEAGESLMSYARRLLALNDEAATALRGMAVEGWVRVGLQQDFGELLPKVLGRFARAHPRVRLEARIARNAELLDRVATGRLDFALGWDTGGSELNRTIVANLPVRWIGPADMSMLGDEQVEPLPIVAHDDACWFRSTGAAALDRVGRPWRVSFTSPNLSGVWAGVEAGLGVTVRTKLGLPRGVGVLDEAEHGLPELASISLSLFRRQEPLDPAAERLVSIVIEETRRLLQTSGSGHDV